MGTCASVPKAMRGEVGGAPPPEPPKEETTATTTEVREVQAAEKDVTVEGGDSAKPEDEKNKDGERRSLGSLLESEEVKEQPPKTVKISSETKIVGEEQKSKALPLSDKAVGEQVEPTENALAAYVAPVARATEEEKETEKK